MFEHSIIYLLLMAVLAATAFYGLGVGALFFLKRSGEKRANLFFGLLCICFSLTLLHNVLTFLDFFTRYPRWNFLPIYFTLAFPPLLFYYVKLNLYPSYAFRLSDGKHFLLATGQFLFFLYMFFRPLPEKADMGRNFYNPFFGAFEQFIYLSTFFAYFYFAYRYVVQKRRERQPELPSRSVIYLEKLLQLLFGLFVIHAIFVVADFINYEFFNINLRTVKPYAALGALSFAALVGWLAVYGSQVIIWGRHVFRNPH